MNRLRSLLPSSSPPLSTPRSLLLLLPRRTLHRSNALPRLAPIRRFSLRRPPDEPLRLAVIGAGPAGFYTAYRVLSKLPDARIDMYEALPVPYGLVRFGVAPDHPEVKNCQDKFAEVASSANFTYLGNVPIGTGPGSLPLPALARHYHALLLSYGASQDRSLGIPGEDALAGIYSARSFVGWYNGLPAHASLSPLLDAEDAVVIGQGNVALDVARILLSPVDSLRKTDIAAHAVEALSRSRVRRVRIVGRRGPLQAAFTVKEVRELCTLPATRFAGTAAFEHLLPPPAETKSLDRAQRRVIEVLRRPPPPGAAENASKEWQLDFLRAPAEFLGSHRVTGVRFTKQRLVGEGADRFARTARVEPAHPPESETVPAGAVFRSIGYRAAPLPGADEVGIPFNPRLGLVPNEGGRVVTPVSGDELTKSPEARERERGEDTPSAPVPGVYVAGWVKRGPTGVIASTMYDAFETADAIVGDWTTGVREFLGAGAGVEGAEERKRGWEALQEEARRRGVRPVSWEEWERIDKAEKERGKEAGKEREKFKSLEEMLAVLE